MANENQPVKVFVSYSWESEAHQQKVERLVNDLRAAGVQVTYDRDLALGERLPLFMEQQIAGSDFVLYLCTPVYKAKADPRDAGVGYESNIISGELYASNNERKFIPVLFSGTWETSTPVWSRGKLGVDVSLPDRYQEGLDRLLDQLANPGKARGHGSAKQQRFIKTPAEVYGMERPAVQALLQGYLKLARTDTDNAELLSAIGYCYLSLGSFEQAALFYQKSIVLVQERLDNYYYYSIALLRGKRPFLAGLSTINQITDKLRYAVELAPSGKYYLLLAMIQQDYFDKKKLNSAATAGGYMQLARQYGVSEQAREELYRLVPMDKTER